MVDKMLVVTNIQSYYLFFEKLTTRLLFQDLPLKSIKWQISKKYKQKNWQEEGGTPPPAPSLGSRGTRLLRTCTGQLCTVFPH